MADELRVVSLRGSERMSRAFSFDVVAATRDLDPASVEPAILHQPATLSMLVPHAAPRLWRGVVAAIQSEGAFLHDRYALRITIVPRLWLLKKRRTSRIFQELTVIDVIKTVLVECSISS
jgi:type VI secretion system secreted protein VgrG